MYIRYNLIHKHLMTTVTLPYTHFIVRQHGMATHVICKFPDKCLTQQFQCNMNIYSGDTDEIQLKRDGIIFIFHFHQIAQNPSKADGKGRKTLKIHVVSFFSHPACFFVHSRLQVDFGEVIIPPMLDVPKPRVLPEFKRLAHGLRSSNISVLDAKTFYIPNLHYDGAGPDAYFWVGNGSAPNIMGKKSTQFLNQKH